MKGAKGARSVEADIWNVWMDLQVTAISLTVEQ